MAKLTRRESREIAFELLFEWSFKEEPLDEIIENAIMARKIVVGSFARELAEKVIENRVELDLLIEQYSQGWKLNRISKTALAVLRMSFCELTKFGNIPVGVSINEAVELVKKFGTDEESAYLNGILGNFEKVRKGLREAPPLPRLKEAESVDSNQASERDEQKLHKEQEEQDIQKAYEGQNEQKEHHIQEEQKDRNEVELIDDIVIEVE